MIKKDTYHINKNAWHVKMMEYIWNLSYTDFSHICPYFWLSILNFFIITFVFLFRVISKPFKYVINGINNYGEKFFNKIDEKVAAWHLEQYTLFKENDAVLLQTAESAAFKSTKSWRRLIDYIYMHDPEMYQTIENIQREARQRRRKSEIEKNFATMEKSRLEAAKRKDFINKVLKVVRPISIIFLVALTIASTWSLIWAGYHLVLILMKIKGSVYTNVFALMLKGFFIGAAIVLFILFISYLIKRATAKPGKLVEEEKVKWYVVFADFLIRKIKAIVKPIGMFFSLVGNMITNNCPSIKWED